MTSSGWASCARAAGELYLPTEATVTHEYIGASPACWAMFSELLAREFADSGTAPSTATASTSTRSSIPARTAARAAVGRGASRRTLPLARARADRLRAKPDDAGARVVEGRMAVARPAETYDLTVVDVLRATTGAEHVRMTRAGPHRSGRPGRLTMPPCARGPARPSGTESKIAHMFDLAPMSLRNR